MIHLSKLEQLRGSLQEKQLDAILITSPINRRYITNFTGTAGVALVTQSDAVFITDFRYTEQATEQIKDFTIVEHKNPIHKEVFQQLKDLNVEKLGFEQITLHMLNIHCIRKHSKIYNYMQSQI